MSNDKNVVGGIEGLLQTVVECLFTLSKPQNWNDLACLIEQKSKDDSLHHKPSDIKEPDLNVLNYIKIGASLFARKQADGTDNIPIFIPDETKGYMNFIEAYKVGQTLGVIAGNTPVMLKLLEAIDSLSQNKQALENDPKKLASLNELESIWGEILVTFTDLVTDIKESNLPINGEDCIAAMRQEYKASGKELTATSQKMDQVVLTAFAPPAYFWQPKL